MSQPTTAVLFSGSDPAAPPGLQNTVPQSDGGEPAQLVSQYMPLAIPGSGGAAGAVKPDGTSITQDPDGTIHAVATSGGGTSGGASASLGQYVCIRPTPDPSDGTGTQFILPAPVLAGTAYWLVRNGVMQRQLGASAEFAVQGTQLTTLYPTQSTDWLEFYYIQGTPNSETGGGGSVNPIGAPVLRGSNIIASTSASSLTVSLPSGTQAGDLAVLFFSGDWPPSNPSGWTELYIASDLSLTGLAASKVLTSGDIATGSVTVSMGGTQDCVLSIVTFIGGTGGVRETQGQEGSGVPDLLTNTTTSAVLNTDMAIYFAAARTTGPTMPTITPATGVAATLRSSAGANIAALMANQQMPGGALAVANLVTGGNGGQAVQVIVMADT